MEHNVVYIGNDRCKLYVGNSRRCAVTESATPPLPYDAEIEYLMATGTQYINTGIHCAPDYSIEGDFYYDTSSGHNNRQVPFGQDFDNGIGVRYNGSGGNPWGCYFGTDLLTSTYNGRVASHINDAKFKVVFADKTFSFYRENGDYYGGAQFDTSPTFSALTMYVFAFSRSTAPQLGTSNVRCYSFIIKDSNDNTVLDLIPVRVEQTGYMYDKVSHQLLGNIGTGDFILGNDKT